MGISVILVPMDESEPLQTHQVSWDTEDCDHFQKDIRRIINQQEYLETPLLRPRGSVAGLYAYYNVPHFKAGQENLRATRLAMACGLLSLRFYDQVLLVRSFGGRWQNLEESEIYGACCISPDLRLEIQAAIADSLDIETNSPAPEWLANAAQNNYHDGAELAKVISAMNPTLDENGADSDSDHDNDNDEPDHEKEANAATTTSLDATVFVAVKSPLCLHCRRLSSDLCEICEGAYFCSKDNRSCRNDGWSHFCLCPTWRLYSRVHRQQLSDFCGFFGPWQESLTSRPHQLGEQPYEQFLHSLGINNNNNNTSWWCTEQGGWAGGQSSSASAVDARIRQSYAQGFSPILDIPPERRITNEDLLRSGLQHKRNGVGLLRLSSWNEYYKLRNLSPSSPVALLCTFPLTIYYAIEQFGSVPVTVARMLKRPLRIHVVGAEKEMNFLDLFQELAYLLPEDLQVSQRVLLCLFGILVTRMIPHTFASWSWSLWSEKTCCLQNVNHLSAVKEPFPSKLSAIPW